MAEGRSAIPAQLRRDVLVESGHRCAIPTCRAPQTELAHIDPWSKVREHTFDNLIALCPNCHGRYDDGQIDRQAMLQYKANLSVLANRYGDLEQRILFAFAAEPGRDTIPLPGGLDIMVLYLLNDGLLVKTDQTSGVIIAGVPSSVCYQLTPKGREFVTTWLKAQPLPGQSGDG